MKTYSIKAADIKREWHIIDAQDQVLGRLAVQAANLLMGKHKPLFSRHLDTGDSVIIINADKIRVTGNGPAKKVYYRHSGYPGGRRITRLGEMMETHPTRVIELAVKGMLPQNRLRARMMKRLRVHAGSTHPYQGVVKTASGGEKHPEEKKTA